MIFVAIHYGHNATVGLSIDGKIVSVISEERITRIKNVVGFPVESLRYIKKTYLENSLKKVDKFLFTDSTGYGLKYLEKRDFIPSQSDQFAWKKKKDILSRQKFYEFIPTSILNSISKIKRSIRIKFIDKNKILSKIFKLFPDLEFDLEKTVFYDHHFSHALSFGYFFTTKVSEKYLIFTMDAEGDNLSSTVNVFEDDQMETISKNSKDVSIGYLYSEVTNYLGFKSNQHEFKVMGMAPYSNQKDVQRILVDLKKLLYLNLNGTFSSKTVSGLFRYELNQILKYERFENICGAIQEFTEEIISEWTSYWIKKTSIKNIVVSGGVFMNIKACKEILNSKLVNQFFIVPSSSDESLIFGSLWAENKKNKQSINKVNNLYLGRSFENETVNFINKISKKKFKILKFENYSEINLHVSNLLKNNEIVARCCGNEEWGARALGNRSILSNPSNIENIKKINQVIKRRDFWMPFSPSILDTFEDKYLIKNKKFDASYMTCLFDSTKLAQEHLRAATHPIDNTLRPQILKKEHNPHYYDLIEKFSSKTNIGALLNTSFNLHGYPNVGNYDDALKTLEYSDLKFLVLENFLIEKI